MPTCKLSTVLITNLHNSVVFELVEPVQLVRQPDHQRERYQSSIFNLSKGLCEGSALGTRGVGRTSYFHHRSDKPQCTTLCRMARRGEDECCSCHFQSPILFFNHSAFAHSANSFGSIIFEFNGMKFSSFAQLFYRLCSVPTDLACYFCARKRCCWCREDILCIPQRKLFASSRSSFAVTFSGSRRIPLCFDVSIAERYDVRFPEAFFPSLLSSLSCACSCWFASLFSFRSYFFCVVSCLRFGVFGCTRRTNSTKMHVLACWSFEFRFAFCLQSWRHLYETESEGW